MRLWRIVLTATAAELSAVGGLAAAAGLGGAANGWLDVLNQFAPIWLAMVVLGGAGVMLLLRGGERVFMLAFSALAVLGSAITMGPDVARALIPAPSPKGLGAPLTVLTLNVWKENLDPDRAMAVIARAAPDVVAVQEVYGPFWRERARLLALYPYTVICPGGEADVTLFSKARPLAQGCVGPVRRTRREEGPPEDRLDFVWMRITAPDGGPVTVATTHFGWPAPPAPRERQLASLAKGLKALGDTPLILTGDFNLTPWSFTMRRQDRALSPLVRRTHALFTWPAVLLRLKVAAPFPLLPIDHVYATPSWRALRIARLPRSGSDHYGLVASFAR